MHPQTQTQNSFVSLCITIIWTIVRKIEKMYLDFTTENAIYIGDNEADVHIVLKRVCCCVTRVNLNFEEGK